jgi:hypothetical protein
MTNRRNYRDVKRGDPVPGTRNCTTTIVFSMLSKDETTNFGTGALNVLARTVLHVGNIHSFIHSVFLTTGPKPLPKRALHIVRSRASSFK